MEVAKGKGDQVLPFPPLPSRLQPQRAARALQSKMHQSHEYNRHCSAYVASPLLEVSKSVRQAATVFFVRLASYTTCHDMYAIIFGRGRLHLMHFGGRDPCCLRATHTRLIIEDIASLRLVCQGVGLSETTIDRQPLSVFRSPK